MPENDPGITGGSAEISGRSTSNYRSVITRSPAGRLDGRSAAGKRVRDLFDALMERLDNPADVIAQADILAWAELKAAAEVARARLLEGDTKSSTEVVRIENLTRRAAGTVGLEPSTGSSEPDSGSLYGGLFIDDDEEPAS